jgi:hypothetical protein
VPQRNLTVFRDEDDFQGVEYTACVEHSLRESAKTIVICSPRSAAKPTEEADAALRSALRESKVRRVFVAIGRRSFVWHPRGRRAR